MCQTILGHYALNCSWWHELDYVISNHLQNSLEKLQQITTVFILCVKITPRKTPLLVRRTAFTSKLKFARFPCVLYLFGENTPHLRNTCYLTHLVIPLKIVWRLTLPRSLFNKVTGSRHVVLQFHTMWLRRKWGAEYSFSTLSKWNAYGFILLGWMDGKIKREDSKELSCFPQWIPLNVPCFHLLEFDFVLRRFR